MLPRALSHAVAAALGVAVLAGCSAAEPPSAIDAGAVPPILTVLMADDWASTPAVVEAIADFEAEHEVQVVTRPAKFSQIEELMLADRAGAQDVDVVQWHAFAAGAMGWALPVTERFAGEYQDDLFVTGALEDVTWDGEVYGVPLDVNAMVLMVNTTLLDQFGHSLDDLRTWEGLRSVAEAAADRDVRLLHLPASTWSLYGWVRANGGHWLDRDPDEGTTLLFDSPAVRETFDFLTSLTADGERMAIADDSTDTDAMAYPLFTDEQTLLLASGTWDVARLIEDDPDFAWTVVPMPLGPSADGPATVLGGSSLYIAEHADDPALAWAFLTDLVEPRHATRYAEESGRLPGRTDVLADPFFDDVRYRVAVDQLPVASAMQLIVYPRVLDLATWTMRDVLNHEAEDPDPFGALQQSATRMLQQREGDG